MYIACLKPLLNRSNIQIEQTAQNVENKHYPLNDKLLFHNKRLLLLDKPGQIIQIAEKTHCLSSTKIF